jgi:hypothetical protein
MIFQRTRFNYTFIRRRALRFPFLIISLAITISTQNIVAAQVGSAEYEQTTDFSYGRELRFNLRATTPVEVNEARLTVRLQGSSEDFTTIYPIESSQNIVLSANISAKQLGLPPATMLVYEWILYADTVPVVQTDTVGFLYYDTAVPWNWQHAENARIVMYYSEIDPTAAQSIADEAAQRLTSLEQRLGGTVPQPVYLFVYPELSEMVASIRTHNRQLGDWITAFSVPEANIVFMSHTATDNEQSILNDWGHEATHLAVFAAGGAQVPGWLNEGLALVESSESDRTLDNIMGHAIDDRVLLSIDSLCATNLLGMPPHDLALAYAQSKSFVQYLIVRYGYSQIQALLVAYKQGYSCNQALDFVLGIPLNQVESQWQAQLSTGTEMAQPTEVTLQGWAISAILCAMIALLFIFPQPIQSRHITGYNLTKVGMAQQTSALATHDEPE